MPEPAPARTGWLLPVLLAVSVSAALGLGYLYQVRPNAGELGAVRVLVTDDGGKSGSAIRIVVAEAPLAQKEVVSPGTAFTGAVNYPAPYLTRPNLKLTVGKRRYSVATETELGFVWVAEPVPEDFRDDLKNDTNALERFLSGSLQIASAQGKLKPGLVFEDFTWEAKGLRAPPSAVAPKTFEQKGTFDSVLGQESVVFFPVPYATPPNVELGGVNTGSVVITECTAKNFKWRNVGTKDKNFNQYGEVRWTAKGVLAPPESK